MNFKWIITTWWCITLAPCFHIQQILILHPVRNRSEVWGTHTCEFYWTLSFELESPHVKVCSVSPSPPHMCFLSPFSSSFSLGWCLLPLLPHFPKAPSVFFHLLLPASLCFQGEMSLYGDCNNDWLVSDTVELITLLTMGNVCLLTVWSSSDCVFIYIFSYSQ